VSELRSSASSWKLLYRIGELSALIVGALYTIELVGVAITGLPPTTAIGFFTLLQNNRLLGLFDLFLLDIPATAFQIPIILALYVSLRHADESQMTVAAILGYIGIAEYFSANTALSMLSLSDQYASASTDSQRSLFLALGEQLLFLNTSTGSFIGYTFIAIAGLIISFVMLRSGIFNRVTACLGIVGNLLELGPPSQFVPRQSYQYFVILIALGGVLLIIWYFLVARRLHQLEQSG